MTEELAQTKEELFAVLTDLDTPISLDELTEILGSTVKHDNDNKAICFLSMLLTFTEEDQINLAFLAESSSGKSYIPLELVWYFPKQDVLEFGYVSPSAFFHEYGDFDKETHTIKVNLERKILVYLDQPHEMLLQKMRPILSHDRKKMLFKIADRSEKSGIRTKNIEITGYSTNIYCAVKYNLDDQDRTRQLLLSPEITQEKIREAVWLRLQKESDRQNYDKQMNEDPKRRKLACRVEDIKQAGIDYIVIPDFLRNEIGLKFLDQHKHLASRQTRDLTRLLAIIKGHAVLNFKQHERIDNTITVNKEDIDAGFKLYGEISEANELGIPPELFKVYSELKPELDNFGDTGFTRRDFQKLYWQHFHKYLGRKADAMLKALVDIGLLEEETDPANKRQHRYVSHGVWVTNTTNNESSNQSLSLLTPPVNHIVICPSCNCQFASEADLTLHIEVLHHV